MHKRNGTVRYGTVRYGTVRYGTVRYGTVRYGTVRYGTVRYGTVTVSAYHSFVAACCTINCCATGERYCENALYYILQGPLWPTAYSNCGFFVFIF